MRTHTALHILCGVIYNTWGAAVTERYLVMPRGISVGTRNRVPRPTSGLPMASRR